MIWNETQETMPREELEAVQLRRLKAQVERVYATVPYYRAKMREAGVAPGDIKALADIRRLPFTTKDDLRRNYPFGLFTVPLERVVRIHASSGTTGQPTVVGYTKRDIKMWAEMMARSLTAAGVTRGDIVHNAYGYGLFTGGLGAHYGAEEIGCAVIPISGGNSKRQITIMRDFGSTVLLSTPSYALNLADTMVEMGIKPADLKLRVGVFGAEPWSEQMRQEIEKKLRIKAIDIYGLSEVLGPGVAIECLEEQRGLHIMEDHFLAEIVDRDTFEPLPVGEAGELVFTTLTKEAFPVIRYRTKDISHLIPEVCTCGRTFYRMPKVTGRTDDMLIIRGVNVFPSQIEELILRQPKLSPHYVIEVSRDGHLDSLKVNVELKPEFQFASGPEKEYVAHDLQHHIKSYIGISARIDVVEVGGVERSVGKAKRVIDKRPL
jgi:phenylacetate-CoA ligase